MVSCLLLMAGGILALAVKAVEPAGFLHSSRQMPWGLLIAIFTFALSLSIGCCLTAAMSRIYGLKGLQPLARRAVFLSVIGLVASFILLLATVENPWRLLVYNAAFPNLKSNIWWLVTLSGITAGCVFLEFATMLNGNGDSRFIFGFLGAVTAVGASNNLAALITGSMDPPLWFGAQLLVLYLISAVLAGVTAVVAIALLLAEINGRELMRHERTACETAAVIVQYSCLVLLGLYIIRFGSVLYRPSDPGRETVLMLVAGRYMVFFLLFGIVAGLLVPLQLFFKGQGKRARPMLFSCLLVLNGLFFQRYAMLLAGQTTPRLDQWVMADRIPGYFPSWSEGVVAAGVLGLVGVAVLVGERVFGRLFRTASQPVRKPF